MKKLLPYLVCLTLLVAGCATEGYVYTTTYYTPPVVLVAPYPTYYYYPVVPHYHPIYRPPMHPYHR